MTNAMKDNVADQKEHAMMEDHAHKTAAMKM
jgi:hypothetical protein